MRDPDVDLLEQMYVKAIERHHDACLGAIAYAAKGEWIKALDHLGDSLNAVDAVEAAVSTDRGVACACGRQRCSTLRSRTCSPRWSR